MSKTGKYRYWNGLRPLAFWLLVFALVWCSSATVMWQGARSVCYHYVRVYKQNRATDTLVVSAAALKGGADLVWIKPHEIRYKGRMYDIEQSIPIAGDHVMLTGHYDEKDDQLFKILKRLVGKEKDQHGKGAAQLWVFDAVITAVPIVNFARHERCLKPSGVYRIPFYPRMYIHVLHPPPDDVA